MPATKHKTLIARNENVSHVTAAFILKTAEQAIAVMNKPNSIKEIEMMTKTLVNVGFFALSADKNKTNKTMK